jgi:hypothetical protein
MGDPVDRRVADEANRIRLAERLTSIETSQKLYHDEMKSIIETMHKELSDTKTNVNELRWTLFGGPNQTDVGLLERFRLLLWKFTAITTVGFGCVTGGLKLFGPSINKAAQRMAGMDDITQYQEQQTKKKLQFYNRHTGKYEYYIEFTPVQKKPGEKVEHP